MGAGASKQRLGDRVRAAQGNLEADNKMQLERAKQIQAKQQTTENESAKKIANANDATDVPIYAIDCKAKKLKPTFFKSLEPNEMMSGVVNKEERVFGSGFEIYGADKGFALKSFPFRGINNHFMRCLHAAFMHHLPLQLRPDDLWLIIAQGIATHIFKNAEKLREKFVVFDGKQEILVKDDSLSIGSKDNDWSHVLSQFDAGCRKLTNNDIVDLMTCDFSTTSVATRTASKCVMFKALSEYISFRTETRSGIPCVSLVGALEDWKGVLAKCEAAKAMHIGLDFWLKQLIPVVKSIVKTVELRARGKALSRELATFWDSVYHYQSISGGASVSGWSKTLFPYVGSGMSKNVGGPSLSPGDFPATYCRCPMKWDYCGTELKCGMYGGIVGMAQQEKTGCVAPVIGWVIAGK